MCKNYCCSDEQFINCVQLVNKQLMYNICNSTVAVPGHFRLHHAALLASHNSQTNARLGPRMNFILYHNAGNDHSSGAIVTPIS
jgi:hypothetical protein